MQFKSRSISAGHTLTVVAALCAIQSASAVAIAEGLVSKDIVIAFSEFTFSEETIKKGSSFITGALARTDPQKEGRAIGLAKQTKGITDKHYHTFEEDCFMVSGTVLHYYGDGQSKKLEAGSYWYVPAGSVHQDACLTDECLYYVFVGGKGETIPVHEKR